MNRPLSTAEHVIWLIDQALPQNFVLVARFSGNLNKNSLRQALDTVQQKHPPLRARIKQGNVPGFTSEGVPEIPLRVMERKSEDHWIDISEKELLEPFPWTKGPLVRLVLLTSEDKCDLLITVCHIIVDGVSALIILQNILAVADKLSRGETPVPGPPRPELPSSFDLLRNDLKYPPGFLDIKSRINLALHKPVELAGEVEASPEKRVSRIIPRMLSKSETQRFISRCREEKTTAHGAICAALLQTVAAQIRTSQDVRKKGPLMIGCLSPVNIRHLSTQPVDEDIGNLISDAVHFQRVDERASLWHTARKTKKSLQRTLKFGRDIKAIRQVGDFLKLGSTPIDMVRNSYELFTPIAVTNVGRIVIPQKFGDLTLEEIHFNASINPAVKNGFAIVALTFDHRLILDFIHSQPYISREKANIMAADTLKRLKEAIK